MATGDTFCDRNQPIIFPRPDFPQPVISFAVEPKTKGEEEKVSMGITRFLEEDPTLHLERRAETRQTILSGMGDLHIDGSQPACSNLGWRWTSLPSGSI